MNRPELTSERFISHPFKEGERLYRTGDLVRYLPDGNIDYLGRMDNQVKIRGFRIELGEIESTLQEHDLVKEVVVIVRENQSGDKRLVAYVVGEGSVEEWREYLKTKLPIHMIPSYFVEMKELPLTINGKVDRKSLPIPDYQGIQEGYAAPRNEREHKLSIIWERVLGSKRIGIYDNFLKLVEIQFLAFRLSLAQSKLVYS